MNAFVIHHDLMILILYSDGGAEDHGQIGQTGEHLVASRLPRLLNLDYPMAIGWWPRWRWCLAG